MEDIVVIGGGPAGNGTALELARAGYHVTVIDYRTTLGDKLCTGIVSAQCLREFPSAFPVSYRPSSSAIVVAPSGRSVRLEKETTQAYVIDRVAYIAGIGRLAEHAGARYLLGHFVTDVQREADRVRVIMTRQGQEHVLEARMVVIASGFGAPFASKLGLGRLGDYALGAQMEVLAPGVEEIEVYVGSHVAPGFFAWLTPTTGGRALLGLLARKRAAHYLRALEMRLQTSGKVTAVIGPLRRWAVPLRPLQQTVGDRVLVVGDAAGQVKPTTGGGIYYALLSSRMAARAIHGAFASGSLSAAALAAYESEWRDLLSKELEAGSRLRLIAERLNDWQLDQIVGVVGANGFVRGLLTSSDVSFDWHGKLAQRVLGFPNLIDSVKHLGFADLWRRLTRVGV